MQRRTRATTFGALTTAVLTGLAALPAFTAPAAADEHPAVYISEIHYDNAGTDEGEAIEVTGPAETDLDGWRIVLYNGSGGSSYNTRTLTGVLEDQTDGLGTHVENYPSNGVQNGAPDGVALVDSDGVVVQFLSYEGTFTAVGGPADGMPSTDIGVAQSGSEPVGESLQYLDGAWTGPAANTFGAVNSAGSEEPPGEEEPPPPAEDTCGDPEDPVALISDIQGSGATYDPDCSGVQTVEAVVTAIKPGLNGFYLQEEAADSDGDESTSEGIFVFTGGTFADGLAVGQAVRVTGQVGEYATSGGASQTQLRNATVEILEAAEESVEPTQVTFPVASTTTLEQYEGMLVELTDTLVISEYYNYDQFGEIVVAKPLDGQDRLYTPTAVVEPGEEARELLEEYALRRITLDDSSSARHPTTIPHPGNGEDFTADNTFRGGDTVTGVVGVIDHTHGVYRIQPTSYGEYEPTNPRPEEAPEVGGRLTVASFNVLNYFLTLDEGRPICGADENMDCRGANSEAELERQRAKILAAMAELDADVVGLMEMENTPGVEPAADLVDGLNETLGEGTYDYIDTGVIGTDAIRLGLIYKPGVVEPVGDFAILDSSVDVRFDDQKNRPMLTQTFEEVATGARFTVSVNHLKSKGSACADGSDPTSGAGNCDVTRTRAAEAIVDFLADDPTGSGDPDHLVIGDLNSYDQENPIDVLVKNGYTDLVEEYGGELAYGYVFDGMAGYLDHALSNETLTPQVTGASEWHINADEPDILDYNLDDGRPADYWEGDPYRSSDHDPVLVGLDLDAPPTIEVTATPDRIWPPNNKWVTVTTEVTATDDFDGELTASYVDATADGRRAAIERVDDHEFRVRAVPGAVYTITYEATDAAGNTTTESVTVEVRMPGKGHAYGLR